MKTKITATRNKKYENMSTYSPLMDCENSIFALIIMLIQCSILKVFSSYFFTIQLKLQD